ncbi:hypothetical protein FHR83_006673 [Actinoplanes campanulatus]|uniref:Uncharacterized protein n=1 Tax=Actinoplanes campanulatus TaxID=113559 RepID=A0A7W5FHZ3_9ACTN|nr:hypothetical protein [Actinoplanes campanulatus]MBB3098967.1 hypothetical protein [Actinoplanes campanulatus]GGN39654.1 hypothetical protein GCM10010109_67830 [Actinoplanes campanulatus]
MTDTPAPTYQRVGHYTVQIGGHAFEIGYLDEAIGLFQRLKLTHSETDATLNLVAWAGRSGPDGGPPTGYILDQHTWGHDA